MVACCVMKGLIEECYYFDQRIISSAVSQWQLRMDGVSVRMKDTLNIKI